MFSHHWVIMAEEWRRREKVSIRDRLLGVGKKCENDFCGGISQDWEGGEGGDGTEIIHDRFSGGIPLQEVQAVSFSSSTHSTQPAAGPADSRCAIGLSKPLSLVSLSAQEVGRQAEGETGRIAHYHWRMMVPVPAMQVEIKSGGGDLEIFSSSFKCVCVVWWGVCAVCSVQRQCPSH